MEQDAVACEQANPGGRSAGLSHCTQIRVRYSETDQMGTFYNSRALEWFEVGRTEIMRAHGIPYTSWEEQGYLLPLVESHVNYRGRARYDDLLEVHVDMQMAGRASIRFNVQISKQATGQVIADGYTVHAIVDPAGRPTRPPKWLVDKLVVQASACLRPTAEQAKT